MSLINIFFLVIALGCNKLVGSNIYIYNLERICVGFKAITCKFHFAQKKKKNLTLGHSPSFICA
jgi:hypothetical protein